jgi:maltose-binding protein MalE
MPNQTECARIFTEQVVEALSGTKTPEEALKFANDEWVKIFAAAGLE